MNKPSAIAVPRSFYGIFSPHLDDATNIAHLISLGHCATNAPRAWQLWMDTFKGTVMEQDRIAWLREGFRLRRFRLFAELNQKRPDHDLPARR